MGNLPLKYKSLPSNDNQIIKIPKEFRKSRITVTNFMFDRMQFSYCGTYLQIYGWCTNDSKILLDRATAYYNPKDLLQGMIFFMYTSVNKMDSIRGNTTDVTSIIKYVGEVVDFDCIRLRRNAHIIIWMDSCDKTD
uniref:Uncharacterized protein n=1 Tax=viral metagenome TaxID=1070528 RepID=A0A6C0C7E8_9ZZZZ